MNPPDTDDVWDAWYYGVFEGFSELLTFLATVGPFHVVLVAGVALLGVIARFVFKGWR